MRRLSRIAVVAISREMVSPVGISGIEVLGAGLELEGFGVCVGRVVGESVGVTVGAGVGAIVDEGVVVAVGCGGCSRVSVFAKKMSW